MIQIISSLSHSQKVDFLVLIFLWLLVSFIFILISLQIKVYKSDKIYFPVEVDYLRALLLSSITSFIINYSYRFISQYVRVIEIWVSFLSILLLSFPQKTAYIQTISKWNLVSREAYLFGAIYCFVSLGFYIFDQILICKNDYELLKESSESLLENPINETVRQRSTLENCLQIRRNSSNLKKILYPESYQYQNNNNNNTYDEFTNLLNPNKSFVTNESSRSNTAVTSDSIQSFNYSIGFESILIAYIAARTEKTLFKLRLQWFFDHVIWFISQFLYQIGIATILSITFIYVPGFDEEKFTFLEKYYYNRLYEFIIEIIFPLFLIKILSEISISRLVLKQLNSSELLTKKLLITSTSIIAFSIFIFTFSQIFG